MRAVLSSYLCLPMSTPASDPPSLRPSLLLVEDNDDTRFLLSALLEDEYVVTPAPTAGAALACARSNRYDIVLMDINLGSGATGVDVLEALRMAPTYRRTPVVALTAYAMPGDRQRFLSMGFTAYLAKPFGADELLSLLADQQQLAA